MLIGLLFLLPAVVIYLLYGLPLMPHFFFLSLTDWSGFGDANVIGLQNFSNIMSDSTFWMSLGNTLYFAIFSAVFSVVLACFSPGLTCIFVQDGGPGFPAPLCFTQHDRP